MSELGLTPENPIVIDRATWLRGPMVDRDNPYYVGDSALSVESGEGIKRCCLGQICRVVDVPDTQMAGQSTPADLMLQFADLHEKKPIIQKLVNMRTWDQGFGCSLAGSDAMEVNDDGAITEQEREDRVTGILKDDGIYITFSGPYAEWDERRGLTESR